MKSIVFCRIVVDENHRNEPLQKETARGCPSKTCPAAPMDKPAQTLCRNIETADRRFSPWKTPLCDNNIDPLTLREQPLESPVRKSARKKPRRRARGETRCGYHLCETVSR